MDPSWRPRAPCHVGDALRDIDTPVLLIDLDAMDYNRKSLKDVMNDYPGVSVRPHAKAHKSPAIAKMQVALKLKH